MNPGSLYIVATPIGNLADISLRALEALRSVDRIAAEDTRHTRKLLSHYEIRKPLVSYHSHNMQKRGSELLQAMESGETIALVTDAGTPGISDPGSLLIRQALEKNVQVVNVPGPAALIAALVMSGLPTQPFAFLGFPPSRGAGRTRFFKSYASLTMTLIIYESPRRLERTLKAMLEFWGNRRIAVARELTKRYEEVYRGTMTGAQSHFSQQVRGEITLVVAGAEGGAEHADITKGESWAEEMDDLINQQGVKVKEAVDIIAKKYGLARRSVYQRALKAKQEE